MSTRSPVPQLSPSFPVEWAEAPIPREPQSPVPVGIGGTGGENLSTEKPSRSLSGESSDWGKSEFVTKGTQSREDFARTARRYFGDGMKLYPINRDRALLAAWGWL